VEIEGRLFTCSSALATWFSSILAAFCKPGAGSAGAAASSQNIGLFLEYPVFYFVTQCFGVL
jgi:hypothetical protein